MDAPKSADTGDGQTESVDDDYYQRG